MKNINILIVEDEPIIAQDIADYLEEFGYTIQGICYDAASAEVNISKKKPDLCLIDINLGKGKDGISLAQTIGQQEKIPFIFLTSYTDDATIQKAKVTMPHGYLSKPIQYNSLKSTIEIALYNFLNHQDPIPFTNVNINNALNAELTPREFELLKDIYDGRTNIQLTKIHFISLSTVKTHVQKIYEKFDCHSRSELIAKLHNILTGK